MTTALRYYVDVFPEDIEEAVEVLAERYGKIRYYSWRGEAVKKYPMGLLQNDFFCHSREEAVS